VRLVNQPNQKHQTMNETSNLLTYSPEQISLLIDGVTMKIKDEQCILAVRQDMANGEDLSDLQVRLNREGIAKAIKNIDYLYGLRVALLNAWTTVRKREQIECN
jgi:hypothetical protein